MIHVWTDEITHATEVWLDTEVGDRDGICLSYRKFRSEALNEAYRDLKAATEELQSVIDGDKKPLPDLGSPADMSDLINKALGTT